MSNSVWKLPLLAGAALATAIGAGAPIALADDHSRALLMPCEEARVSLDSLAIGENGEGVKTYYEGAVLMMQVDMVEPAAQSSGLVILMTDLDDPMARRTCLASQLFTYVNVDGATSSYNPASGLQVTVPTMDYDVEGLAGAVPGKPLNITIDLGKVTATATR